MTTFDKPWLCGTCGYMMDACSDARGTDAAPQEHDITLCLNCGGVHVREAERWRPITTREFTENLSDDERKEITTAQNVRAKVIRRDLSQRGGRA